MTEVRHRSTTLTNIFRSPRASLITPNLPEAAALLDAPVAASEAGCAAVLSCGFLCWEV
jgi:hydroxymethylpyrimidine/phosphomethylpyrimidine kinase